MIWNINSHHWAEHLAGATLPQTYIVAGDINGQTPQQCWDSEEVATMNMIAASVPDHIFNHIKSKTNTHEVWTAVKAIYQTWSKMITVNLGKKIQSTKMGDDNDAQAHLTLLLDLQEQLASMGKNYDTSVNWEVFRVVKDWSLTALTALNTFRHPSCFTDVVMNLL
jgi:hypothetical protein